MILGMNKVTAKAQTGEESTFAFFVDKRDTVKETARKNQNASFVKNDS